MNLKAAFTRKQACELTGLSGTQVDYLCKLGIVVPEKIGGPKRPVVLYTWNKVIELKIFAKLKERKVPTEHIQSVVEKIREHDYDLSFCNKYLLTSLNPEIRKKINEMCKEFGEKPPKFTKPEKYALGIEKFEKGSTVYLLLTREEINTWINELLKELGLRETDVYLPVGDIHTEIKEAAAKHHIDLGKVVNLSDAA
jgi:DNA-binding transcriptional MerR regulator